MFAAFKGKCHHCGHDHDESATPAPAPVTVSDEMADAGAEILLAPVPEEHRDYVRAPMRDRARRVIAAALEAYESARGAVDGWVACSERMPEVGVRVWVTDGEEVAEDSAFRSIVRSGVRYGLLPSDKQACEIVFSRFENVTHWCPMHKPTPPPSDKAREVNDG